MREKKLTPENIKIHIDSICVFLRSKKNTSEIIKFNSRFYNLKHSLLSRKIITETKVGKYKFYKSDKDYVLFPKDYKNILKEYSKRVKEQNDRFFARFPNIKHRVINTSETKLFNPNITSVPDVESNATTSKPYPPSLLNDPDFSSASFTIQQHPTIKDLFSQIDSLKHQIQLGQEVHENAKASYEKKLNEKSDYITEKLVEIESLKQELFKQKSTNKHYIIKFLGIPLIKIELRKT